MRRIIFWNIAMNFVLSAILFLLDNWALSQGFEETFIAIALLCGAAFIVGNALFVTRISKAGSD